MAKFRKHKMFRRAPSKPRAPRPKPGPARAGFTYGYQWSAVQPEPWLRFPIEEQGHQIYPLMRKQGDVTLLVRRPAYPQWWRVTMAQAAVASAQHPALDTARIAVALDWHMENGFDLNPFHLSGRSWGAVRFMRGRNSNPIEWMDELVDFWRRIISDGTPSEWGRAPDALWWLDRELVNPDFWYDRRERLWPRDDRFGGDFEDDEPEPDEEEPDEPDAPEEDDITTEDHQHWYQNGRLYFTGDEQGLSNRMADDAFWPNVWFISDHGNAHPITLPQPEPEDGGPRHF